VFEIVPMKKLILSFIVALVGSVSLFAQNAAGDIDYEKARQLFERQKSGQTLTADERAHVARAMASKGGLNPEPYAYESAFAARWLIQRQVKGDAELAETKSPLLLWGPYLWADGTKGRKLDSLVWERSDFGSDGVHPGEIGREKVSKLLLNFLTNDPLAKSWFAK
jgi:hypothetical protein